MVTSRRVKDAGTNATRSSLLKRLEFGDAPPNGGRVEFENDNVSEAEAGYSYEPSSYAPRGYTDEELMPTIKTMDTLRNRAAETKRPAGVKKSATSSSTEKGMNTSAKFMVGIYAVILAIAAILIIATSVAAARKSDAAGKLAAELERNLAIVEAQEASISGYLSTGGGNPALSGYEDIDPSGVKTFQLKELKDERVYEERTNWFDKLCRWLSGG